MTGPVSAATRDYSRGERLADGVVHVMGIGASLIAMSVLLTLAVQSKDGATVASLAIYALGAVTVFIASAAYNMDWLPERREVLRRLDHAAIFVKIAATYTPFAAISIGGAWGVGLLGVVWSIAAIGVPFKLFAADTWDRAAVALYLAQGWIVVIAVEPLLARVSWFAVAMLALGGVLYTVGVVFHLSKRLPFHNAIWHAFVLAASGCMYAAVMGGVALA